MSRVTTLPAPARSPEPVFPLSVEQYHQMIDAGVLTDDDPVELIDGILVYKMPKKPKHTFVLRRLSKAIEPILPQNFVMRLQEPISLSTSEPEPDAAIVSGVDEDFIHRHPGPAETVLVIEVADATLRRDRGIKLRMYARAGIAVYWIVDLVGRTVEVYTDPESRGQKSGYGKPRVYREGAKVPIELRGRKVGAIAVADVLPD